MSITVSIRIVDITQLNTDAIVNAANEGLRDGGGVCGAIFSAAGSWELQEACAMIGYCKTGNAVITPGFRLKAKHIIHAVGPIWMGGVNGEAEQLYQGSTEDTVPSKEGESIVDSTSETVTEPIDSATTADATISPPTTPAYTTEYVEASD